MINPEVQPQFSRPAAGRGLPIASPTLLLYAIPVLLANDILALGASLFIAWEARLGLLPVFGSFFSLEVTVDFYHHLLWVLVVVIGFLAIDGLYTTRLP